MTRQLAAPKSSSRSCLMTVRADRVCGSLLLLHGVRLILSEAELRLTVDGQPESKRTATAVLHLKPSDAKASTELALENLKRDISIFASRTGEIVSNANGLVTKGNDAIGENKDLFEAFKDTFKDNVAAIDAFVKTVDNIADVRIFGFCYSKPCP